VADPNMIHPGFRLERHDGRIVVTLTEKATVAGWYAAVCALIVENAWPEAVIYDMRAVESAALLLNLPNLVPVVKDLTGAYGRKGPIAALVCSSECSVWRQRLSTLFADLVSIDAFSDITTAQRWLDEIDQRTGAA
jgi:hypothetical protein